MKILHTADWHLGRSLHGFSLTEAFQDWCNNLLTIVEKEQIEAVLIAGDVYDRSVASTTMVELLSNTLTKLANRTQVVVISGNHDSAIRLGFGAEMMRPEIHIRTRAQDCATPILLTQADGTPAVILYAIPYLDPDSARYDLASLPPSPNSEPASDTKSTIALNSPINLTPVSDTPTTANTEIPATHSAVMSKAMEYIIADITHGPYAHLDLPIIIMAHAFFLGAQLSNSETTPDAGGIDGISTSIFQLPPQLNKQISYVALGHIHRPQSLNNLSTHPIPIIRYSGSPITFSFQEEKQSKSAVLLEFSTSPKFPGQLEKVPTIRTIELPAWKKLITLNDTYQNFLSGKYAQYANHFVVAQITDPERPINLTKNLQQVFPYLVRAEIPQVQTFLHDPQNQQKQTDPLEALKEFFTQSGNRPLTQIEIDAITQTWQNLTKNEESASP